MTPNFILSTPMQRVDAYVMEDLSELTLQDLCRACTAQADIIIELVEEGVIEGLAHEVGQAPDQWRFTGLHLHRAKVALRLHRDLGVNFAGAALALQLMEEMDVLRGQIGQIRDEQARQPD